MNNDYFDFMILFFKLKTSSLDNEEYQLNDFDHELIDRFFDIKDENGSFIKSKDINRMVLEEDLRIFEITPNDSIKDLVFEASGLKKIKFNSIYNLKEYCGNHREDEQKRVLMPEEKNQHFLKASLQSFVVVDPIEIKNVLKNKINYFELYNTLFDVFEEMVLRDVEIEITDIIFLMLMDCKTIDDYEKLSNFILETDNVAKRAMLLDFLRNINSSKDFLMFPFKCILYRDILKILGDQQDFMAISFFLGPYYKSGNLLTSFLENMENKLKEVEELTGQPMNTTDDYFKLTDDQLLLLEISNFEADE